MIYATILFKNQSWRLESGTQDSRPTRVGVLLTCDLLSCLGHARYDSRLDVKDLRLEPHALRRDGTNSNL